MTAHFLKLTDSDLRNLSLALRSERIVLPISALAIQRIVSSTLAPGIANDLQILANEGFTASQLATLVDLLLKDRSKQMSVNVDETLELVTTGPAPDGFTNRDTSVVVRELFANANTSVLVAGYAVYQGQRVFQALADRMQEYPNLSVRLFLDIQRPQNDTTADDTLAARFANRFRQEEWPSNRRLPEVFYYPQSLVVSDKRSCLHAKCVIVDSMHVFVSSANFTQAAQERNIEMGLLLRSERLAEQIVGNFDTFISVGTMRKLF